ncbi:MAG: Crp/Fnr family transcriptional regulator [Roseburia sp.]
MVLSGSVDIMKEDFWGNTNLITRCLPGDIFGESYTIRPDEPLEMSIWTGPSTEILFLNVSKMMTLCANACALHNQLTRNLLSVLAERNFQLSRKLEHLTKRSTREKLLSYLTGEARHQGNASFDIPFNRQQLADYLSVDRSAMSSELGRLRDEELIQFRKNHFTVLFPSS